MNTDYRTCVAVTIASFLTGALGIIMTFLSAIIWTSTGNVFEIILAVVVAVVFLPMSGVFGTLAWKKRP